MNTKVLIGALIGGVAFFLLGWLVYGIVLESYMKENCTSGNSRPMEEFVWWALILSNLISGYFLALVLSWTNTSGFSGGMQKGALIGLLFSLSLDLSFYSMTTMYSGMTVILVDVAAGAVMWAIAGGVVGWYMGMGKTSTENA